MEKSKQTSAPFYAEGLKFSCKRCSSCCRYDSGYVFISENDLKRLLSALRMDRDSFLKTYCRWVQNWNGDEVVSLKEKSNKDCILWDDGCKVYEARPLQCVSFPFWETIVSSKEAWEIAAASCPGMNVGVLHSKEEIESSLETRSEQPTINRVGGDE